MADKSNVQINVTYESRWKPDITHIHEILLFFKDSIGGNSV